LATRAALAELPGPKLSNQPAKETGLPQHLPAPLIFLAARLLFYWIDPGWALASERPANAVWFAVLAGITTTE